MDVHSLKILETRTIYYPTQNQEKNTTQRSRPLVIQQGPVTDHASLQDTDPPLIRVRARILPNEKDQLPLKNQHTMDISPLNHHRHHHHELHLHPHLHLHDQKVSEITNELGLTNT